MKNLKYTLIVIAGLLYNVDVAAQKDGISFFDSPTKDPGTGVGQDDGPADGDPDPSPINDYLPLLVVGGLAVAFYNRKKLGLVKN